MALSYTLRYRPTGTEEWTEVTGLTGTSHPVTGLTAGVRYDIEVVAVSSSGASSTPLTTQR
jgi:predicted phage tail protein